jgi:autotransporter translocation and assembly factor TamB
VHALDASSVVTADTVYTWTINVTAPSITGKPSLTSASSGPSFTFTDAPYTSFACKLDAGAFAACTSPKAYSGLADGSHTFTVHALDANSVATSDATYTWTVNTAAPTVTFTTKTTGGTTTATATISHPAYTTFQCALDAAAFSSCTSGAQFAVATGSGLHTVHVRAVDGSGVTTTVANPTFTA